jgi:TIR domain
MDGMDGSGAFQAGDEFDVALSFASENRSYVQKVAEALTARGIRVFYDANEEICLWGKHLSEALQQVYMRDSHAVVMFISKPYAEKQWTRHERRSALQRAIQERDEYILPVRFDMTELEGLSPGLVYQDLKGQAPEQLASKITQKLVYLGIISKQLPKAQRECKHPYLTIEKRSALPDHGSLFWIDPKWKDDPRNRSWSEYADVLVRVQELSRGAAESSLYRAEPYLQVLAIQSVGGRLGSSAKGESQIVGARQILTKNKSATYSR